MQLQKATEYAIRILHYLHSDSCRGDIPTAQTISQAVCTTYPHAVQIIARLRKNGLITSVKGRNGGYGLARSGHKISIYDVVLAMEGEPEISYCLGVKRQYNRKSENCDMQDYFKGVKRELTGVLSGKYIADFGTIWNQDEATA